MICDDLSYDEIFEAFLIYASLHGHGHDTEEISRRVQAYVERNVPDACIDDAILAYLEDRVIAPPDVVLPQWGSSRFYEVKEHAGGDHRHRVCEAWFQNGCLFPVDNAPAIAHFWTEFEIVSERGRELLHPGQRLRFELVAESESVEVQSSDHSLLGYLPRILAIEMNQDKLRYRRYLPLVDRVQTTPLSLFETGAGNAASQARFEIHPEVSFPAVYRLLVVTAKQEVELPRLVDYAAKAYLAKRSKC